MKTANYEIVPELTSADGLVIRDIGPWDKHPTVTNDADAVVERLVAEGQLPPGRELFYYDSEGRFDQIIVENGKFLRFKPRPQPRFYYESDGERSAETHYIVFDNPTDPNGGKRLDCNNRKQALAILAFLKSGEYTMEGAASEVKGKWL